MKTKLLLAASILTLSTVTLAFPPKPAMCPGAASLAAAGLDSRIIARGPDGLWAVGMLKNKYDTNVTWTFIIARISANDAVDAFNRATANLKTLTFQQGPVANQRLNKWECFYSTASGYAGIAANPSLEGESISSLSHSGK